MLERESFHLQRDIVSILETSVRQRVLHASYIKLLSDRNDKVVEVVRDIGGGRFIRRRYDRPEVSRIEQVGLSFGEAWDQMHEIFNGVGIAIVPSVVLFPTPAESKFPVVVASEYIEGTDLARSSNADLKIGLAESLGSLLFRSGRFRPSLECFARDMFRVRRDEMGVERLVLIDVDPYLADQTLLTGSLAAQDAWYAAYIAKATFHLGNDWCQTGERRLVISAFIRSLAPMGDRFKSLERSRALDALMNAHGMTMGIDLSPFG